MSSTYYYCPKILANLRKLFDSCKSTWLSKVLQLGFLRGDTSVSHSWYLVKVQQNINICHVTRNLGIRKPKKKRFPVRLGSLGHVYSVGGFFLTQNGWYRKNQDWLLKKERNQRRPGRRRRWSCKLYGELLVEGPIYFAANGVRRGLAMARLKWFFIKYCKLSFLAPLLFWKICAIRIIINFTRGLRG